MMRIFSWFIFVVIGVQILSGQITPPFTADFESSEGYSLGDLGGQNGWILNQGQAKIISGTAFSGNNLASLILNNPFSQVSVLFNSVAGDEISFVDFYIKPKAGDILNIEEVVDSEGALIGFVKVGSLGEGYVFNGDGIGGGQWLATNAMASLTVGDVSQNWIHLTLRQDFNDKIWDLYIGGTLQAINLGLIDDTSIFLNEFVLMGDLVANVNFDLFSLTFTNPLFTDADKDGIDDAYESLYGLNSSLNDRDLDPDSDGLNNIEEFLSGSFANNPDSDGDFVNDGDEILLGTDPIQSNPEFLILGSNNLFLRLRADSGIVEGAPGFVASWEDQSGNGYHATQSNTNRQPAIVDNQINGNPVVRFDGLSGTQGDRFLLASEILDPLSQGEIFAVLKATSALPASDQGLWNLGQPSKYPQADGTISDGFGSDVSRSATPPIDIEDYHVYSASSKPNEWIARINGSIIGEATTNTVDWKNNVKIGRSSTLNFAGDFAEILIYDRVLTVQERDDVLNYLAIKYNIATALSDTDSDGLPDDWEIQFFGNLDQGANDDPDGDGIINIDEFTGGTDPTIIDLSNPPPGIFFWFRAETGIVEGSPGFVTTWEDQSGNGYHASQINTNRQPAIVANQINGIPVVRFDGLSGTLGDRFLLDGGILNPLTEGEIFTVLKATSALPVSDQGLWNLGQPSKYPQIDGTISDGFGSDVSRSATPPINIEAYHLYSASSKPNEWIARINGSIIGEAPTNTVAWKNNVKIGRSSTLNFAGDFAEILMFDRVLTTQERNDILTYISNKYNIAALPGDTDFDGLPDSWEIQFFGDLTQGPNDDPDGDGITNLDEFNNVTDPTDYYNGVLSTVSIVTGNNQTGDPNTYLVSPLVVSVIDAGSNPLVNAPVEFSVTLGTAQVAVDNQGTQLGTTLTLRTDALGEVSAFVLLGPNFSEANQITATASTATQSTSVVFDAATNANPDTDLDGLLDAWELQFFGDLTQGPTDDTDGDGITNLDEFNNVTDPTDYYNGVLPTVNIVSGNNQSGDRDTYLVNPLVVSVTDAGSNPLINAPVEFSVTLGTAQVAVDNQGTQLGTTLTLRTDAQGEVSAFVLLGSIFDEAHQITATASTATQSTSVVFDATTNPNPDTDSDGLLDSWELQFFGDLTQGPNDDPDGDGITNLDEFNGGNDPTDYYNGVLPTVNIVSGNIQTGDPNTYLVNPLVVSVIDAGSIPLVNAPIEFSVTLGSAQVAEDNQGTQLGVTLTLRTDAQGEVSAFVLLGSIFDEANQITATAFTATQSTAVVFDATTNPNPDTDSDGLLDAWELQFFGDLTQGPNDDPDGDGISNLDEFNAGTDPTDRYNGLGPLLGNPDLFFWLKADAGIIEGPTVGFVETWEDQSGNGHDVSIAVAIQQPAVIDSQANGLPVVRFDGIDDRINFASGILTGVIEGEIFAVLKATAALPASDKGFWLFGSNTDKNYPNSSGEITDNFGSNVSRTAGPAQDIEVYHIYSVYSRAGEWVSRLNGTAFVLSTTNTVAWSNSPVIGNTFDGDFAEIAMFDRVLTPQERDDVITFLSTKYSVTAETGTDNDGDLLPDAWELLHFGDLSQLATDDTDGDGTLNLEEFFNNNDPNKKDHPAVGLKVFTPLND